MRTSKKTRAATPLAYTERVNRAMDYVLRHADEPLRLKAVARAAHLSPFHFHRVFQAIMGETLADFVKRERLRRALAMMAHPRRKPLTRIALDSGFTSSSDFSRCFRKQFGVAPSAFNIESWQRSHQAELVSTLPQAARHAHLRSLPASHNPDGFRVRVRELPPRRVAYIRVRNPYKGDAVFQATQRLVTWATSRSLDRSQWLGFQWENPELVPLEQCRYHAAVEASDFTPRGEIGDFTFPPMLVAQVEVKGGIDLELRALQWLYGSWLPRSGYVPDDHPCFEAWIGLPFAHGTEHFELHVQLPVRPT